MTEMFADREDPSVRIGQYSTVIPNFITARIDVTSRLKDHQLSRRSVHDCYIEYCKLCEVKPLAIKVFGRVFSSIIERDYKFSIPPRENWESTGDNEEAMRSWYGIKFKHTPKKEEIDEIHKGLYA